jgi:superfamily I DNA/RNA helicase
MDLTLEQQEIQLAASNLNPGECIIVNSVAGSGKSTTARGVAAHLHTYLDQDVLMTCFNTDMASENRTKVKHGISSLTIHSWLKRDMEGILTVDVNNKQSPIYAQVSTIKNTRLRSPVMRLVAFLFNAGYNLPGVTSTIKELYVDSGAIKPKGVRLDDVFATAEQVFNATCMLKNNITFDMLLWRAARCLIDGETPKSGYDTVIVDEAQDLGRAQLEWLLHYQRITNCRIVFVGDENQALYQFRGACAETFSKMYELFNVAAQLSLSRTFRCSGEVLSLAQKYVPRIKGDTEGRGKVVSISVLPVAEIKPGSFVISRFNKDLVVAAISFLKSNVPINYSNEKYFQSIFEEINKNNFEDMDSFYGIKRREIAEFEANSYDNKAALAAFVDMWDCMEVIMAHHFTSGKKLSAIQDSLMPTGVTGNRVLLSTIHKAKGLEAEDVYFIGYADLAKKTMNLPELNAIYVGVTRALGTLYLVN